MTCYIVTFEVANIANRNNLIEQLKTYGIYCPIHDNCWAIVTPQNSTQIRDFLMSTVLSTDRIFVIKSGVEAAWSDTYGPDNASWLKERL